MSEAHHARDRKAAYTGIIVGVIVLAIVLYGIVQLTNRLYAGPEGAKPEAGSSP